MRSAHTTCERCCIAPASLDTLLAMRTDTSHAIDPAPAGRVVLLALSGLLAGLFLLLL